MRREMRQVYDVSWIAVSLLLTTFFLGPMLGSTKTNPYAGDLFCLDLFSDQNAKMTPYGTQIFVRAGLQRPAGN